jgi:RNA polymerase sigma-70 factor, ECF subfamily
MMAPISKRNASSEQHEGFFGWVTQLVHTQRARLSRLVVREGVRADDALDCVQEAFLSFLQLPQARLLVGSPEGSAALLSTLARNIARNRRRRHDYAKPHVFEEEILQSLPSDALSSDEVVIQAEQHALAFGCLVTLNEVQEAVVHLRLVDDVPGEDVALQLGTTPEHVGMLLFRARQRLQHCLTDYNERPAPQGAARAILPKRRRQSGRR